MLIRDGVRVETKILFEKNPVVVFEKEIGITNIKYVIKLDYYTYYYIFCKRTWGISTFYLNNINNN